MIILFAHLQKCEFIAEEREKRNVAEATVQKPEALVVSDVSQSPNFNTGIKIEVSNENLKVDVIKMYSDL